MERSWRIVEGSGTSVPLTEAIFAIKIIDLSGAVLTTLAEGSNRIAELQWSNAGLDQITYEASPTGALADHSKYLINTTAGSTPTVLVAGDYGGYGMYWSPDNTELVYWANDGNSYRYELASGTKTLIGAVPSGDWK